MGDNTTDFSSRVLCSDGTCIGVIGSDGKCKECGKPFEHIDDDTVSANKDITKKIKNTTSHISVDEKGFKCKTCGFIAFGVDLTTAKHKKCLGCGNIMGREPIKKRPSSYSDSLLEVCQNCKHQFSQRASKCPKCQQERTSPCFVCKKQIPHSSKSCPECGDPAPFEQQFSEKNKGIGNIQHTEKSISTVPISAANYHEKTQCAKQEKTIPKVTKATHSNNHNNSNIEFTGTIFGWFWRGLATIIISCFVIPAPWILSWFFCWFVGNITKAGNNTFSFTGCGSQIWLPVMMGCILPLAGRFFPISSPSGAMLELLVYLLLYIAISCYFYLLIIRWFFRNILSSTGTKTYFMGEYLPYFGWNILSFFSFISIVGWAWVNAGMARWVCSNVRSSNNHTVGFRGKGWAILWRTVTYLLSCLLIIPIPWTSFWLIKWYISNVTIEKQ